MVSLRSRRRQRRVVAPAATTTTTLLLLLLLTTATAAASFSGQEEVVVVDSPQKPLLLDDPPRQWTLNFSSPAPHAFAAAATLLHQWANTVFPNGHGLAAVEVPAYTLLYHGLLAPGADDADGGGGGGPEPPSPEWLAFDLEMANGIMGSDRHSFLLAYQATRSVKALYFDGASAALAGRGQMDTQMLHLFGNVSGPPAGGGFVGLGEEYLRAHGLCDWLEAAGLRGRGWGFEGVVRMNAGFEMIWCDFLSPSLRLVSRLNVTAPLLPGGDDDDDDKETMDATHEQADMPAECVLEGATELPLGGGGVVSRATSYYPLPPQPTKTDRTSEPSHPAPPPNMRWDRGREPFLKAQGWGWFDSATWHYGASRNGPGQGEVRAKVLGCGILSYYAPRFANQTANRARDEQKSLNLTSQGLWAGPGAGGNRTRAIKQLARRRRYHHLGNVTWDEAMLMRSHSERALRGLLEPRQNTCSGADWTLMTSEIVQRVTNQLTMLDTKLALFPAEATNETQVYKWLFDLRAQSHLFMVAYLEYPPRIGRDTWSTSSEFYRETHARCKYRYTRLLVPEEFDGSLSPEEQDMRYAVEEVYGAICSVLITMGFGIEQSWLDMLPAAGESRPERSTTKEEDGNTTFLLASQAATWRDHIAELTAWLGWESQYYGCKEMCAWDERCYIPMWPMIGQGGMGRGGGGPGRRRPGRGGGGDPGRGRGPPGHGGGGGHHGGGEGSPPPPPPPPRDGDGDGPGHRPDFKMPPRGMPWMEDSDLWEPRCVNATFIMGE